MREPTNKKLNVFPSISMALLLFKNVIWGIFSCASAICVSSLEKRLFTSAHFLIFFFY